MGHVYLTWPFQNTSYQPCTQEKIGKSNGAWWIGVHIMDYDHPKFQRMKIPLTKTHWTTLNDFRSNKKFGIQTSTSTSPMRWLQGTCCMAVSTTSWSFRTSKGAFDRKALFRRTRAILMPMAKLVDIMVRKNHETLGFKHNKWCFNHEKWGPNGKINDIPDLCWLILLNYRWTMWCLW